MSLLSRKLPALHRSLAATILVIVAMLAVQRPVHLPEGDEGTPKAGAAHERFAKLENGRSSGTETRHEAAGSPFLGNPETSTSGSGSGASALASTDQSRPASGALDRLPPARAPPATR